MNELIAVAVITILAVISPGPDFAMVTRNSYTSGRKAGLFSAMGIAVGVQVHVIYTIFGIAVVIAKSHILFTMMKFIGAGYLIYIGFKSFTNKNIIYLHNNCETRSSNFSAFQTGFFTNAFNPKAMLFVISSYTQIVHPGSSLYIELGYGFFMSFTHWLWFSLVAVFFSAEKLRLIMVKKQFIIDKIIGVVLMLLGFSLIIIGIKLH